VLETFQFAAEQEVGAGALGRDHHEFKHPGRPQGRYQGAGQGAGGWFLP
jgi:hypothetical protein